MVVVLIPLLAATALLWVRRRRRIRQSVATPALERVAE
jgi:hypothetical protein